MRYLRYKRSAIPQLDLNKRESAAIRGYGRQWQQARLDFLALNPLCKICESQGIVKAAKVVDHITPHKGDARLFWDRSNWQPLCSSCHSRKTAAEDGGFGNRYDKTKTATRHDH